MDVKANFFKSRNSITVKVTIPASIVKLMNITEEERDLELNYDGKAIIITKKGIDDMNVLKKDSCFAAGHLANYFCYIMSKKMGEKVASGRKNQYVRAKKFKKVLELLRQDFKRFASYISLENFYFKDTYATCLEYAIGHEEEDIDSKEFISGLTKSLENFFQHDKE